MKLSDRKNDCMLNEMHYVDLAIKDKYSNFINDYCFCENGHITCTWLNAIDMELIVGEDGPISINSQLYKSIHMREALIMYSLFPPKRLVQYHFSPKNKVDRNKPLIWGESKNQFVSYEDYFQKYIDKVLNLFYETAGVILPQKYINIFEKGNPVIKGSYIPHEFSESTLLSILQYLFKDDIRLLDSSSGNMTFLIYENQVYDIICNDELVVKRRCSDDRSITIYKVANSQLGKRLLADFLFVYTFLITSDCWLEKYSRNDRWKIINE